MFVRSKIIHEAVQFTLENPHPGVRITRNPDGSFFEARIVSGELDEADWDCLYPGDWILTGGGGRLFCVPASTFKRLYEEIKE